MPRKVTLSFSVQLEMNSLYPDIKRKCWIHAGDRDIRKIQHL